MNAIERIKNVMDESIEMMNEAKAFIMKNYADEIDFEDDDLMYGLKMMAKAERMIKEFCDASYDYMIEQDKMMQIMDSKLDKIILKLEESNK